ncbi:TVP38/TMEM64 family protein [Sneathiella sp.]|uniref:TVP38/TMEM64 family protein n=1 Tax=Sneathiella sp. TaxID=1964365 RepID=UPI0026288015|nr:TVP38/TMEM64 family protein [Sneathiella sp.]MDF2366598.1 TVP38/TMEM64 family protein [Sneathiella sp.]
MLGFDKQMPVARAGGESAMGKATGQNGDVGNGFSLKKMVPLLVIVGAIAAFFVLGLDDYLTFRALSDNRDRLIDFVSANFLLAALLYMGLYIIVVAFSLPGGLLMTVTGGFLFGWLAAGLMTVFAATVGATILFLIAATSLGEPLRKKAGPKLKKLEDGFAENALSYLLFLRLVPLFPFWLVNIAPAFLGVKLSTYIIGTFVGIIPGTFVFAYLGGGLDSIIREQQASYQACLDSGQSGCVLDFQITSLVTTEILFSFIALGVIALLPIVLKKFRKSPN